MPKVTLQPGAGLPATPSPENRSVVPTLCPRLRKARQELRGLQELREWEEGCE